MDDNSSRMTRRRYNAQSKPSGKDDISYSQETTKKRRPNPQKIDKSRRHNLSQSGDNLFHPQPSTSQQNMSETHLSQDLQMSQNIHEDVMINYDEEEAVSRVVKYLLITNTAKHGVQRIHIIKHALGGNGKNYQKRLTKAESYLNKVFGYNLVEYDDKKYILCNELNNPLLHSEYSQEEKSHMVLLFIVLSHIFMNEGSCKEDSLWSFIESLGIPISTDFVHDYFGDIKHLVSTEFVKQHYLEVKKIGDGDNVQQEYRWGSRANEEVSPRKVLELVTKIFGQKDINYFQVQYNTLKSLEKSSSQGEKDEEDEEEDF